ncbi:MAG TPA: UPF0147 family protein [Thermoplasmata archaeon]|jgi:uncharacterized protein|nr:UPF0147 family protein [Thermoplasmata archaeon]
MTGPRASPDAAGAASSPMPAPVDEAPELQRAVESISELADDPSVPRNIRRGALAAKEELSKPRVARDVRIASAVYVLDDLANDPNLPTHGRTAIWSIISALESVQ